ncbi:MAG: ATP-dependent endonuclease [Chloroflexota bacterium]|nr:ATP-dependent endonuclease [Chloroflexota bacterium]
MLIRSITLKNFRCYCEATLNCERLTAILGRNGSGKSTLLHALNVFYDTNASVSQDDFYSSNTSSAIEIRVVYADLNTAESEEFAPYIVAGELAVTKRIELANDRFVQKYYASTRQIPCLVEILNLSGVNAKRDRWNELVENKTLPGIGPKSIRGDNPDDLIAEYTKAHPEETEWVEQETQFFGPKNIGGGRLDKFTKFVYIPAVHDVSEDFANKRGTPIHQLLDMIVVRRFSQREDVQKLKQDYENRLRELHSPENLQEFGTLAREITSTMRSFVPNAELRLEPVEPNIPDIPLPSPIAKLIEDDFEGAIDRKGHGLQRVLIFSLLRYMAVVEPTGEQSDSGRSRNEVQSTSAMSDGKSESENGDSSNVNQGPDLIIGIEEPELYQHPLQARHLSEVLLAMSRDDGQADRGRNQILYTTHSAYFVDLERFEQLRIACKRRSSEDRPAYSILNQFSFADACSELARVSELSAEDVTGQSFRAHAYPVMTNAVNEGFFADAVVIVEGQTEVAALLAVSARLGQNWLARGIAVIPAEGKTKIDKPVVIFRGFGIPTYYVFDADGKFSGGRDHKKEASKNRQLLRLASAPLEDFPETQVNESFACFGHDFESYCKEIIGTDDYQQFIGVAAKNNGYPVKNCIKNYDVVTDFIELVYDNGKSLPAVEDIVRKVASLADSNRLD